MCRPRFWVNRAHVFLDTGTHFSTAEHGSVSFCHFDPKNGWFPFGFHLNAKRVPAKKDRTKVHCAYVAKAQEQYTLPFEAPQVSARRAYRKRAAGIGGEGD